MRAVGAFVPVEAFVPAGCESSPSADCGSISAYGLRESLYLRAAGAPPFAGCGSISVCGLRELLHLRSARVPLSAGYGSPICVLKESSCPRAVRSMSSGCKAFLARGVQGPLCPRGAGVSQPPDREAPAARRHGDSRRTQIGGIPQPADRGTPAAHRRRGFSSPQTEVPAARRN
jgi:hypothetical protein